MEFRMIDCFVVILVWYVGLVLKVSKMWDIVKWGIENNFCY